MKTIKSMINWLAACGLALVLFCSFDMAGAAPRTVMLKVSTYHSAQDDMAIVIANWGKELEKRSSGRIKVRFYPGATLAPAHQQYDAVVKGTAEVANHVLGYTMHRFPLSEVIDLPLGIPSGIVASRMMNEYYNKFTPKEFDDVKVLWLHGQGPGYICTRNKPVEKMEEFKGLRIRTYGGNAQFMSSLGAGPVAMPMTEVYEALSRGMVDGILSGLSGLYGFRNGEHIKYVTLNNETAYTACQAVIMNKKIWASLSPDLQKIIDGLSKEWIDKTGQAWDDRDKKAIPYLQKLGCKFVTLSKSEDQRWREMGAKPLFDDYVKRMKAKQLQGDQALSFVLDYLKKNSGTNIVLSELGRAR